MILVVIPLKILMLEITTSNFVATCKKFKLGKSQKKTNQQIKSKQNSLNGKCTDLSLYRPTTEDPRSTFDDPKTARHEYETPGLITMKAIVNKRHKRKSSG